MSSMTAVLASGEFFSLIVRFQDGVPQDMLPFLSLRSLSESHMTSKFIRPIGAVWRPWLDQHGFSRLPLLLKHLKFVEHRLLVYGAYTGHMALLRFMANHLPPKRFRLLVQVNFLLRTAATGDSLPATEFLVDHGSQRDLSMALEYAAQHASLALVQVLYPRLAPTSLGRVLSAASSGGNRDVMAYFIARCTPDTLYSALSSAIRYGKLLLVQDLYAAGCRVQVGLRLMVMEATERQHKDILMYVLENATSDQVPDFVSDALIGAIRSGSEDLVSWLWNEFGPVDISERHLLETSWKQLAMVECLMAHRSASWDYLYSLLLARFTSVHALVLQCATEGHSKTLQWIVSFPPTDDSTNATLDNTIFYDALYEAAFAGKVDVVTWLFDAGFVSTLTFDAMAYPLLAAVTKGHTEAVAFLVTQIVANYSSKAAALEAMATSRMEMSSHLGLMGWLDAIAKIEPISSTKLQPPIWDLYMQAAVACGRVDVVDWLNQTPCIPTNTMS
ncbi:Aste57867_22130 [Aphanomyces stellatus]|uniref:Aste57867_22130 protein n=1 Tax=Aphanomyces stellatus TaxID=120398 RepID=A0A485LJD9_9STRA|nr:hypothetical protein As57867_022061 [Aphanomyces stellatus]VFT98798.1 Aste57867_22130 [Aphanomyces stellatus]